MKNNIYIHVPYHLLDEYLNIAVKHKINIEIYFSSEIPDSHIKNRISEYRDICEQNNIKVILHAPYINMCPGGFDEKMRRITIERFIHAIDIAKIFTAESIVFHTGYDSFRLEKVFDLWCKKSLATWNEIAQAASAENINILIENIFDNNPNILTFLIEEINLKNFGCCLDTGHFNMFSDISLEKWISESAAYIKEFHMHNNYGVKDTHNSFSDGTFDFKKLFQLIERHDITANITIESHGANEILKSIEYLNKNGYKQP